MSFGFSVGDFLAVLELANKIRREFVDAPTQFKDISNEFVTQLADCLAFLTSLLGSEASRSFFKISKSFHPNLSLTNSRR